MQSDASPAEVQLAVEVQQWMQADKKRKTINQKRKRQSNAGDESESDAEDAAGGESDADSDSGGDADEGEADVSMTDSESVVSVKTAATDKENATRRRRHFSSRRFRASVTRALPTSTAR
jgi:hypothetical protein